MEKILTQILKRMEALETGQHALATGQQALTTGQQSIISEQGEMRKEMAFYYANTMRKLDETKSELSSEIKHISTQQEDHQKVLELLNQRQ